MNSTVTYSKPGIPAGRLAPLMLLLLCLGLGQRAAAQILNLYSFSQSSGTYTPITGGTLIVANTEPSPSGNDSAAIDDFTYATVNLPFTFNFDGAPYTSFRANSNGWILFGAFTGSTSAPISSTSTFSGAIAGFAADLMGPQQTTGNITSGSAIITNVGNTTLCNVGASILGTGIPAGATITAFTANTITISSPATSTGTARTVTWTAGEIRTETQGTAPNRVCVVQFKNMSRYAQSNNGINFQIRLSEGGGVAANQTIQIVYGNCFSTTSNTGQVGLRGPVSTDFSNRTSTTSWDSSVAGTTNGATMTLGTTVRPSLGKTYTWTPPPNCSGKPVAGTIIPVTACAGQSFQLSANGPAVTLGLTYQWQDSTPAGWQNSVGASATARFYTATINTPTWYRLIVNCGPSGQADTTPAYLVSLNSFIDCYCIPTYSNGGGGDNITSVTLRNMTNNSTAAANPSPYYVSYTTQQPNPLPIPALTMGQRDTVVATFGTDGSQYSGMWIDFNRNGTFEASEFFTAGANAGANGTARIAFTTPLTAQAGLTRMRVRGGDDSQPSATQACGATNSGWGEAEDYLVNIQYPPCSGPLDAGIARASETSMCYGYDFNLIDTTHEYRRSQMTWSWQSSLDGGLSWNDVANSTNKDTLNNVVFTAAVSYRLKMVCNVTDDSTFSNAVSIAVKAPYQCYCYSQSNGGSNDISDIGAVVIGTMVNSTGGPHILNPTAVRRRTDYTSIPNIVMNADGTYHLSIYHTQRNAIHHDARVSVFIDFNNDLRYDINAQPAGERVFTGVTSLQEFYIDTVIRIPNAVIPNVPTGMRVILNDDVNPNSPANLGCGPYMSGETEDYVVTFRRVPAGVGNVNTLDNISLYPNPTGGRFTVSAGSSKAMDKVEVNVTTIAGQVMMHQSYEGVGTTFSRDLDLSQAAKGIYFVEIRSADGSKAVRKLIVR